VNRGQVIVIVFEEIPTYPTPSLMYKVEDGVFCAAGRFVYDKAHFDILHEELRMRHLLPQIKEKNDA